MRRTRRAAIAATTALAFAAATGCSAPSENSNDPSPDTSSPTDAVTLTMWDFIDPSQDNARSEALRANIEAFEAANEGISIQLEVVSFGDILSRLPQASAAGQGPDIVKMYTPLVPQMIAAGAYQPLPDAHQEITDWLRPIDDLVDVTGSQIAVPYEYRTCALVYSETILDEIGAEPPRTWDEVVDVASTAGAAGYVGFGTGFSEADNSAIVSELFDCFMAQLEQPIVNDEGEAVFATENAQEFSQFLVELKEVGGLSENVVADQYSTVTDGLANGTSAMAVIGTHRIKSIHDVNPAIAWAPLPAVSSGRTEGATFNWTLGVGSSSAHPEAAWAFIEFMTGTEAQERLATGGEVPVRAATYDAPFFATDDGAQTLAIREYVETNSSPRTYPDNWLTISAALAKAGQRMYLGDISAEEVLEGAQAAVNG